MVVLWLCNSQEVNYLTYEKTTDGVTPAEDVRNWFQVPFNGEPGCVIIKVFDDDNNDLQHFSLEWQVINPDLPQVMHRGVMFHIHRSGGFASQCSR